MALFFKIVFSSVVFVVVLGCHQRRPTSSSQKPPNIVFIVADDLGWADVSWNNDKILSPNLHALYNQSVVLDNYYVQQVCTPSRAAILTGYYPIHLGLQHFVIEPMQPNYLPLNATLLPQILKRFGYATHAVGKWHLGFCDWPLTPTYRGFDSFYGFWTGMNDHFTHAHDSWTSTKSSIGLDFRDNLNVVTNQNGTYSVHSYTERIMDIVRSHNFVSPLFLYIAYQNVHNPIQVPDKYIEMNRGRGFSGTRLQKAAMVTALDEGVQNVTEALRMRGVFDETIIIFTSDNGGPVQLSSLNFPYRGSKDTLFEGGTKGVAFMRAPALQHRKYGALFHAVDWLPTLLSAVGNNYSVERTLGLDGIDQWDAIVHDTPGARNEILYNIDEIKENAAIRVGNYKLIVGDPGDYKGWYTELSNLTNSSSGFGSQYRYTNETTASSLTMNMSPKLGTTMLFDLKNDPAETQDVSKERPELVDQLYQRIMFYYNSRVPVRFPPETTTADPKYWNFTWSPGWCRV